MEKRNKCNIALVIVAETLLLTMLLFFISPGMVMVEARSPIIEWATPVRINQLGVEDPPDADEPSIVDVNVKVHRKWSRKTAPLISVSLLPAASSLSSRAT